MQEYDGRVADVRDIEGFDFQPGLVTVELLDGKSPGLLAIGDLRYAVRGREIPAALSFSLWRVLPTAGHRS